MSSRRVDIRTTRKARPTSESVASLSSNTRTRSEARAPQQSAKKKSTKISKPSSSKKESSDSKPEQTSPSSEAQLKSRRRRADTSGYIRRRFLYDEDDDNFKEKAAKSKTSKSQKRVSSHETKYRTSPLALMAASSANYQRKRKKNTDRSPSPVLSRSPRGRRGRRPKVFSPQIEGYSEDNMSSYDVEASEDEEFSEGIEGRIPESYSHRRPRVEYDENTQLIKPVFRRIQKRDSYRTEGAFSSESHQDYESNIPDLIFDDGMSDFTRHRGPVALGRRTRHRIVPQTSLSRNEEAKQMSDYHESEYYGMADSDPDFRHQVRGNFSLDHGISMDDSSRLDVNEWGGHMGGMESDDPNSNIRQTSVDIEDFAGDLLPQTATNSSCPPASGSSRRKSPVRPMQVIRNEMPLYHSENGGNAGHSSGANLIQPASTASAGLVDLCAAAVLDSSSGQTSIQVSQASTQIPISNVQSTSVQPITSTAQYSLINPGLVSLQPDGRVFVDTSVRAPITGYTITSTPPMSKISLMQARINYGSPQNVSKSRVSASLAVSSKSGGLSNSSANSSARRRPTILKRKEAPPTSSANPPPPPSKVSPVNRPPPPPFMRNALRNMQTSPLMSTLQRSVRPVTYTIVSPGQTGGIFTVTPTSNLQQSTTPSASSQTASSRLFGPKRTSATSITEVRPVPPSQSNVAVISCLPAQSVVTPETANKEECGQGYSGGVPANSINDSQEKENIVSDGSMAGYQNLPQ
ncbi:unnamed protein product [Hymenolepis diminuta]|uniref:DUF4585 domain-containing protein n=1 Tax=Hymenolepis diminuta TaxID=6216 RepID=A0A0R3STK0_HYMDI|nr:unnamed protein product [Hymenolepis diminuta]